MRDIAITAFIMMWLPLVFKHPWIGAVLYAWVSVMNPHKLAFGFAFNFPFAQLIAITTLIGVLTSRDDRRFPGRAPAIIAIVFFLWTSLTTMTAIEFEDSVAMWLQFAKNFLMFVVTMAVLKTRRHVDYLIWAMVIAIGFFSFKGGLFTVATGGVYRVWGPDGGKIQENNALAVATIMTIPLMRYLQLHTENRWLTWKNKWLKGGLSVLMVTSVISALGSQSRGASRRLRDGGDFLVEEQAQGAHRTWNRDRRVRRPLRDVRAMGGADGDHQDVSGGRVGGHRLFAWETMYNIAKDQPVGPDSTSQRRMSIRDMRPTRPSHGSSWPIVSTLKCWASTDSWAFSLFLTLWFATWRTASRIMAIARNDPEKLWARDFAAMCQVSLVAYVIGGAFLNLAYFELPYYIMIALVAVRGVVDSGQVGDRRDGSPRARRMGLIGGAKRAGSSVS